LPFTRLRNYIRDQRRADDEKGDCVGFHAGEQKKPSAERRWRCIARDVFFRKKRCQASKETNPAMVRDSSR
jgi:hypothetical protein